MRYTDPVLIKVREKGKKRWAFLTPKGGTNGLRVHAMRVLSMHAEVTLGILRSENPNHEFKAVR